MGIKKSKSSWVWSCFIFVSPPPLLFTSPSPPRIHNGHIAMTASSPKVRAHIQYPCQVFQEGICWRTGYNKISCILHILSLLLKKNQGCNMFHFSILSIQFPMVYEGWVESTEPCNNDNIILTMAVFFPRSPRMYKCCHMNTSSNKLKTNTGLKFVLTLKFSNW